VARKPPGRQHGWIPGGIRGRAAGREFQAEATLSCHRRADRTFHTLILRDIEERLAAEARIQALSREANYLREELRELANFEEILGQSPALRLVLEQIERVAPTDATVLVLGESGTGKELVASALHERSARRTSCASIAPRSRRR
jgi:transcriptional regulator with GAF, ATPase, and Fis domain